MKEQRSTLAQWVERLQRHPLPTIELKLERMRHFLGLCGNPEQQLPPVIHVAGTNGKGSTLAFLHAICNAAGYRDHRYTSPHLVRFNERFIIADNQADDALLVEGLEVLSALWEACPLTYFEATTALAFYLFARHPADMTLLEVGMGGRLDATNVVVQPALTVITPISLDHQEFLGETIAKIAYEKAGIMKEGVPCVVGKQHPDALQVIQARAQEVGAPLYVMGKDYDYTIAAQGEWEYRSSVQQMRLPSPSLQGLHQYENAALAVACIEQLPHVAIDEKAVQQGIASAVWHGRLQLLEAEAVQRVWGITAPVYIDGGHNEAGARMIAAWLAAQPQPFHLVMGLKADKEAAMFMRMLAPYADSLIFVPLVDMAHHAPAALVEMAHSLGVSAMAADCVTSALTHHAGNHSTPLLVTGSLYLVGEMLSLL